MGTENRDWYREELRRKTGYVERAKFRVGANEKIRRKPQKPPRSRLPFWVLLLIAVMLFRYLR